MGGNRKGKKGKKGRKNGKGGNGGKAASSVPSPAASPALSLPTDDRRDFLRDGLRSPSSPLSCAELFLLGPPPSALEVFELFDFLFSKFEMFC